MKIIPLFLLATALLPQFAIAAEEESIAKIQSLPTERCQHDLTQLHNIYGQMRSMSAEDGQLFLKTIAENIRKAGLQIPPPPAPCSAIHFAVEQRCGNIQQAMANCQR